MHTFLHFIYQLAIGTTASLALVVVILFVVFNDQQALKPVRDLEDAAFGVDVNNPELEPSLATANREYQLSQIVPVTVLQPQNTASGDEAKKQKKQDVEIRDIFTTPASTNSQQSEEEGVQLKQSPGSQQTDEQPTTSDAAVSDGAPDTQEPTFVDIGFSPEEGVFGVTQDLHLANFYGYDFHYADEAYIEAFATYDLVVGVNAWDENSPSDIEQLEEQSAALHGQNPQLVLLDYAFIGTEDDVEWPESYYLHDYQGNRVSWWPGSYVLNFASAQVRTGYLDRIESRMAAGEVFDGIFYDGFQDSVSWLGKIDINNDGFADSDSYVDSQWRSGLRSLLSSTRDRLGDDAVVYTNGSYRSYDPRLVNGIAFEDVFNSLSASSSQVANQYRTLLGTYLEFAQDSAYPRITSILQGSTVQSDYSPWDLPKPQRDALLADGYDNYQVMRFGLGTALMGLGYYAYDLNDRWRGQTWLYDEYSVDFGRSLGDAEEVQPGVWRRDYEECIVIVNASNKSIDLPLGDSFWLIDGVQDPDVNQGVQINRVQIDALDARVLLR